jgi:hypothetical protein
VNRRRYLQIAAGALLIGVLGRQRGLEWLVVSS